MPGTRRTLAWPPRAAAAGARRLLAGAVLLALAAALLGLLGLGVAAVWYGRDLPPLTRVTDYRPRQHLRVLTADGDEIAAFGSERRVFVPIAQMPRLLKDAVLAIEDTQFYEHHGISPKGVLRAALANLSGGLPQGGSTITQQVARTFFLSMRRTAERKIKEALLALQIERELGKDQILELYMNQIYLGQRAYGFGAAAQVYFGKPLDTLRLAEAAMLAGLPQNPVWANPMVNADRARRRQLLVLARMRDIGRITPAEHDAAVAERLELRGPDPDSLHAEHVAELARQAVIERFGEQAYTLGLQVTTSIRSADQRHAHAALRRALVAHEDGQPWRGPERQIDLPGDDGDLERAAALALKDHRDDDDLRLAVVTESGERQVRALLASGAAVTVGEAGLGAARAGLDPDAPPELAIRRGSLVRLLADAGAGGWRIVQWPQAEGAFVALDPHSGRVRALVGGFDFNTRAFNHVTDAWRQPGSAFAPFLYSAAFEHGVRPETVVDDLPLARAEGATRDWAPKNGDGRFDGPITVREALVRSKDLVGVRLLRHVGVAPARDWIARFGFEPQRQPGDLTLALGAGGVTPLQLAAGYAVFASGGWLPRPVLIERIVDARGQVLFEAPPPEPPLEGRRVVPAANAFLVRSLLADAAQHGTAARVHDSLRRSDLYGKSGAGGDGVDAWFAGFHPGLVAVAWIGYDEPRSLGRGDPGSELALSPWIDFMGPALRTSAPQPLRPPPGVVRGVKDWRVRGDAERGVVVRISAPHDPLPPGSAGAQRVGVGGVSPPEAGVASSGAGAGPPDLR